MIRICCRFLLFVLCFSFLVVAEDIYREDGLFGFGNFVQLSNQALSGAGLTVSESRVRCGAECAVACLEESRCRSYNLAVRAASGALLCQLLSADQFSSSTTLTASQQFHHFTITVSRTSDKPLLDNVAFTCRTFNSFHGTPYASYTTQQRQFCFLSGVSHARNDKTKKALQNLVSFPLSRDSVYSITRC